MRPTWLSISKRGLLFAIGPEGTARESGVLPGGVRSRVWATTPAAVESIGSSEPGCYAFRPGPLGRAGLMPIRVFRAQLDFLKMAQS